MQMVAFVDALHRARRILRRRRLHRRTDGAEVGHAAPAEHSLRGRLQQPLGHSGGVAIAADSGRLLRHRDVCIPGHRLQRPQQLGVVHPRAYGAAGHPPAGVGTV